MKNILIFFGVAIAGGLLGLAGCSSYYGSSTTTTTVPSGPTASVSITDSAFVPQTTTVTADTTVIWTNNGTTSHRLVCTTSPATFDSGAILASNSLYTYTYSFKFTTVGTYPYHESGSGVTGEVIVQ